MKLIKNFLRRLSFFDIVLIGVLLIVGLGTFFFFYRKAEYITIRVKVTDQDVLYANTQPASWYANRFVVGDSERDALGRKITELTSIESFNVASDRKAVYLDLRVRATFDSRTKLYSARGKPLVFGTPMRFNLSYVTFDGFVTEFPGSENQTDLKIGTATITALARGLEPTHAVIIKKGDQIFDSNKVLLAEVKEVVIKPAERVTQTDAGELLLRPDPLYRDIIVTVQVRTKTSHGEIFAFDNLPLKVGEVLPLNFAKASFFPMITDFKLESTPTAQ